MDRRLLKICILFALSLMSVIALGRPKPLKSSETTTHHTLAGETSIIESSALWNWRGACRDWAMRVDGPDVIEINCGQPKCEDEGEYICFSKTTVITLEH